jgi:hypothetical protein
MSTHPNAMLILALTPHGLARKTMAAILADAGIDDVDDDIKIGGVEYHHAVCEDAYDEETQITAKEGDLVFWDLVTYGYGDRISWGALASQQANLEAWAQSVCQKHACDYEIFVGANYW